MANLVAQWSKLATGRSTSNSFLDMIVDFCNLSKISLVHKCGLSPLTKVFQVYAVSL